MWKRQWGKKGNWGAKKGKKMNIGKPNQELSTTLQHGFLSFLRSHRPSHMLGIPASDSCEHHDSRYPITVSWVILSPLQPSTAGANCWGKGCWFVCLFVYLCLSPTEIIKTSQKRLQPVPSASVYLCWILVFSVSFLLWHFPCGKEKGHNIIVFLFSVNALAWYQPKQG